MKPFNVPAGAQMLLGAPAKPMPQSQSNAIAKVVANIEGIVEAHLPQCFAVGVMDAPAQILVVVLSPDGDASIVLNEIGGGLKACLPNDTHLDVWPVKSGSSMLDDVRGTGCEIYRATKSASRKPWWRFW